MQYRLYLRLQTWIKGTDFNGYIEVALSMRLMPQAFDGLSFGTYTMAIGQMGC